jgi:hypothetical protein
MHSSGFDGPAIWLVAQSEVLGFEDTVGKVFFDNEHIKRPSNEKAKYE